MSRDLGEFLSGQNGVERYFKSLPLQAWLGLIRKCGNFSLLVFRVPLQFVLRFTTDCPQPSLSRTQCPFQNYVQWATKVMTPASMYFLRTQGSWILWPTVHNFCPKSFMSEWFNCEVFHTENKTPVLGNAIPVVNPCMGVTYFGCFSR